MKGIRKWLSNHARNSKLGMRLLLLALLVAFCTSFIFGAVISAYISSNTKKTADHLMNVIVTQYGKNVENNIDELDRIFSSIVLNENVIRLMRGGMAPGRTFSVQREVQESIMEYSNFRKDIIGIYLYAENGEAYSSRLSRPLRSGYTILNEQWYINYGSSPSPLIVFRNVPEQFAVSKSESHISFVKSIFDFATGNKLGAIEIALNEETFSPMPVTEYTDNNTLFDLSFDLFVIDSLGKCGSFLVDGGTYSEDLQQQVQEQVAQNIRADESFTYSGADGKYYSSYYKSPQTGLTFFSIRNLETIIPNPGSSAAMLLFIGLGLSVFVALIIALFASKRIFIPLRKLQETMRRVSLNRMDERAEIKNSDEVGSLALIFNEMVSNLDEQVQTNLRLQREKDTLETERSRCELDALQSQINPHFLYNALEVISMAARKNNDFTTQSMAVALGRLLRAGLIGSGNSVPLSAEIEHIRSYVKFQNMFFNRKIEVRFDIPEDLIYHKVVRLILQPIVENAVKHMPSAKETAVIRIFAFNEGDTFHIHVKDNGAGFTKEDMESINDDLVNSRYLSGHPGSIGLANTNKRIQLAFLSPEYGLRILESGADGTTVAVLLPFSEEDVYARNLCG